MLYVLLYGGWFMVNVLVCIVLLYCVLLYMSILVRWCILFSWYVLRCIVLYVFVYGGVIYGVCSCIVFCILLYMFVYSCALVYSILL